MLKLINLPEIPLSVLETLVLFDTTTFAVTFRQVQTSLNIGAEGICAPTRLR